MSFKNSVIDFHLAIDNYYITCTSLAIVTVKVFFQVNRLRDVARKRVHDRPITHFHLLRSCWGSPFVWGEFYQRFCQKKRPDFVSVWTARIKNSAMRSNRDLIIYLDLSLLAHVVKLHPILTSWIIHRHAVFLRVYLLPERLISLKRGLMRKFQIIYCLHKRHGYYDPL